MGRRGMELMVQGGIQSRRARLVPFPRRARLSPFSSLTASLSLASALYPSLSLALSLSPSLALSRSLARSLCDSHLSPEAGPSKCSIPRQASFSLVPRRAHLSPFPRLPSSLCLSLSRFLALSLPPPLFLISVLRRARLSIISRGGPDCLSPSTRGESVSHHSRSGHPTLNPCQPDNLSFLPTGANVGESDVAPVALEPGPLHLVG